METPLGGPPGVGAVADRGLRVVGGGLALAAGRGGILGCRGGAFWQRRRLAFGTVAGTGSKESEPAKDDAVGFLDKAKAAANDLAAKADSALGSAESSLAGGASPKQAEPMIRDLGVIAYLEATGRPLADADEQRRRCVEGIQTIESQTTLNLQMTSAAPPAPGTTTGAPPGPTAAPPPPASAAPPPPPGANAAPPAPPAPAPPSQAAPPPPPGQVAPPPPPASDG